VNDRSAAPAICPFCGSSDADMLALFGQQLMTAQYYCNACRTPFERVKSRDVLADAWSHAHAEVEGESGNEQADRT
jgi:formate dehydrogenase maturation protein FdhE